MSETRRLMVELAAAMLREEELEDRVLHLEGYLREIRKLGDIWEVRDAVDDALAEAGRTPAESSDARMQPPADLGSAPDDASNNKGGK